MYCERSEQPLAKGELVKGPDKQIQVVIVQMLSVKSLMLLEYYFKNWNFLSVSKSPTSKFASKSHIPKTPRSNSWFRRATFSLAISSLANYAKLCMGLPMGKLVVATNSNDVLARFWCSGRYEQVDSTPPTPDGGLGKPADGGVQATFGPAMDIIVSSNFERLFGISRINHPMQLQIASGGHLLEPTIDGWMKSVKTNGRVEVPVEVLELVRRDFLAERVSDDQVCVLRA